MPRQIDPQHDETRTLLRMVGPAVAIVGVIFTAVGVGSFFSSFGSFEPPRYFWCAFVGLPLIALGSAISKFAFLGAVTRYLADEVAPVGKDVVNYMAAGTQDAIRDVTAAVSEGLRSGEEVTVGCPQCKAANEATANFCKACGGPIQKSSPCSHCGEMNDPDARFCDNCGRPIGD